ncbi:OLC1v1013076C1 [Oldenlandia corymbosa var. corymbosa]|uniref:OLC1v1013076C1 n=1 Tax=Oldenlandia corymbosa var. corymbosa TaxID=529605 RepID=A0AAV1E0Y1_OLDCO|nr:OLC1v1013076C1 [Oldenlandia corymbosa var. corymbosa]
MLSGVAGCTQVTSKSVEGCMEAQVQLMKSQIDFLHDALAEVKEANRDLSQLLSNRQDKSMMIGMIKKCFARKICWYVTFDEAKVKLLNCKQNGRSIQSYFEELEGFFLSSGVVENDYMLTDRFHYGLDKRFKLNPKIRRQSRLYEAYYTALEVEREHDTSCGWNGPIEDQGPIKEERMDLDYLCDRELVQESYDQVDGNVINFGVQTKGDDDLMEISAEEYQECLILVEHCLLLPFLSLFDGDHLANTNEEGQVAANNGEDEQVEDVNANGGSKDAALKNNPYIRDLLSNIVGPMTRARRKRMNESLNSLIVTTWAKEEIKLEDYKPKTINLLQVTPNGHGPFGEKNFGPQSTRGPPATFPE